MHKRIVVVGSINLDLVAGTQRIPLAGGGRYRQQEEAHFFLAGWRTVEAVRVHLKNRISEILVFSGLHL